MSMIRRNKRTKEDDDDLKVALHECAHVVVAELEGFPYQYVVLCDDTLKKQTGLEGFWAPPDDLKHTVESANESEAESLLTKLAAIAYASYWIDVELSGFSDSQANARNAGDWQAYDELLSVSVVPDKRKTSLLEKSKELFDKHRNRQFFLKTVTDVAQQLVARRKLYPNDVRQIMAESGLIEG